MISFAITTTHNYMDNRYPFLLGSTFLLGGIASAQVPSICTNPAVTLPPSIGYVIKSVTDFGAVPDDLCSDQLAFEKASAWFTARGGNGELVIPQGTYIVGRQINGGGGYYKQGVSPLKFTGVSNFILRGVLNPASKVPVSVIRYDDCLRVGMFDPSSGQRYLSSCDNSCYMLENSFAASIGDCIHMKNCGANGPVVIRNLEIDGNVQDLKIGGKWADTGLQFGHNAIFIDDSKAVSIDKCLVHHMACDGLIISALGSYAHAANMGLSITNNRFEHNGRSGCSWTGGAGVSMANCEFSWNGTDQVKTFPSAGLNIECHFAPVRNGTFTACKFRYNRLFGMITDAEGIEVANVSDHQFIDCLFVGSQTGSALWPKARALRFDNCDMHGKVVHSFNAQSTGVMTDRTIFTDCNFNDTYAGKAISPAGAWLFEVNTAGGLELTRCRFTTCGHLLPFYIVGGTTIPWYAQLSNIEHRYEGGGGCGLPQWQGVLNRAMFTSFNLTYPQTCANSIGCGASPASPRSFNFQTYGTGSTPVCNMTINPLPVSNFAMTIPTQYTDPVVASLPMCITCGTSDAIPCAGSPNPSGCGPIIPYPCCSPCNCYRLLDSTPACTTLPSDPPNGMALDVGDIWSVFPNPANDHIEVSCTDPIPEQMTFELLGLLSQDLKLSRRFTGINMGLRIGDLPSGPYLCRLLRNGVLVDVKRIVIAR